LIHPGPCIDTHKQTLTTHWVWHGVFSVCRHYDKTTKIQQPDGFNFEQCTAIVLDSMQNTEIWHDVPCAYNNIYYYMCETNAVNSYHTGIIRWHDVHRRLCYWGQPRSYSYHTLAWRTSSTVLFGSTQAIQVWYSGRTYIVVCVIGVISSHTGMIRWQDVHRRLCYWGHL